MSSEQGTNGGVGSPPAQQQGPNVLGFPPTIIEGVSETTDHPLSPGSRRQTRYSNVHQSRGPGEAPAELMGPLLRRKKVLSLPIGYQGDFFVSDSPAGGIHNTLFTLEEGKESHPLRSKQKSLGPTPAVVTLGDGIDHLVRQNTPPTNMRQKQSSGGLLAAMVRRKQISLDLLGPNDFFVATLPPEVLPIESDALLTTMEEEIGKVDSAAVSIVDEVAQKQAKLFRPLRFAPRLVPKRGISAGHGGGDHAAGHETTLEVSQQPTEIDPITQDAFVRYIKNAQEMKFQILSLQKKFEEELDPDKRALLTHETEVLLKTNADMKPDESILKKFLLTSVQKDDVVEGAMVDANEAAGSGDQIIDGDKDGVDVETDEIKAYLDGDDGIIRAQRSDKIKAFVCLVLMFALTIVVATWETHSNENSHILTPVGLACVTTCVGNLETRDFFDGHNQFETDEVIELLLHLDPNSKADPDSSVLIEIIGSESGQVKATLELGPVDPHERLSFDDRIKVTFDNPEENHVINVSSTDPNNTELSFTLIAEVRHPISDSSVIVAAIIMISVYFFILIEAIHRTLVAIFGSMVALMFLFIMNDGNTESIGQIMLFMEWSTLGLLFGMMIIVGELSHTGIFEWISVCLLVASKGSFNRLLILLCTLTAVSSAFLDNVTTMLLVAPVTIDMCNILDIDPRPYLISEVLMSNVGGTATLIGDPPNIIIGSSFEEIGFVDFIVNVLPCIFLLCIPITIAALLFIYRFYLTSTKMRVLDAIELKKTYPIYDEPRLMISGTVTFFVIVMFFLHPVHEKDTAWIALLGAFVCIAFTNPHDVQDALRNHVEWDTLLFFAGLFVLVEVCAEMGLLSKIGELLASYIKAKDEDSQLTAAISLLIWVSAITSAFLDNIPYTATMIPVITILNQELPDTLPLTTLAWALSFGACLGGNGTLLGASANIVTAGISTNKGYPISFLNFMYPGMVTMILTVAVANLYMLVVYVWL